MRRPENDVAFKDGLGYTVDKEKYTAHVSTAKEIPQVRIAGYLSFC